MDTPMMVTLPVAQRAVEDATRPGATTMQREQALDILLSSTSTEYHADLPLLQYVTHQIPVLTHHPELERWRETALGKAYDLMEGDIDEIRILGYQLALALGQQHGASMGEVTDVLSQALIASIDSEDYTPREQSSLFLAVRSIIRLDPAALTIIIPAIIQDPGSTPEKREKLCGYLERETFGVVGEVLKGGGEGDGRRETEAAIRAECEAAITSGDPTIITFGVHLLAVLPTITGKTSTLSAVNSITSLLIKCIEQSPSSSTNINAPTILQSYYSQLSFFLSQTTYQPDPRWFLYLYCAKPLETARWAQKRLSPRPGGAVHEAPNRLMDWLKESWNLWRLAHDKPEIKAQVPPELQITELSRMCKVVLAQLPVLVPTRMTVADLAPVIDQLELQLLLAYFIFLKFRGQLEDIYDDRVKDILEQITRVTEEALERTMDLTADPVMTRRWQNVLRMSYNLVHKGSLDAIVPSWQVSTINLAADAPSMLGDDVVAIPSVSAPRSALVGNRRNQQQRRPPHAARYFDNTGQTDAGTHSSASGSTSTTQRYPGSDNPPPSSSSSSFPLRSGGQFEMLERTASGSSAQSGSSKRKRDLPNTQQQQPTVGGAAATPSRGLAERLGIALPSNGSNGAAHVEDEQDMNAQQQQNKKRKAKSKPNQLGQVGESGSSGQKPAPGAGNLSPGMSLLQRLNMGGSSNTSQHATNSPGQSNGAQGNVRSNGQSRVPPRVMPNAQQQRIVRPPNNSHPSISSSLSHVSMNSAAPSSAPSGPGSNRLKLSTTPSNPASLISRLSGAPAHARSPIPMAPIAPSDFVKPAAVTSVNGAKATSQGNAHEQVRPLGPVIGQTRPVAVVQPAPATVPFNPNDGIKRKGRGFANAGYAV